MSPLDRSLYLYSLLYSVFLLGGSLYSHAFSQNPIALLLILPLPLSLLSQLIPRKGLPKSVNHTPILTGFKSKLKNPFIMLSLSLYLLAIALLITKSYLSSNQVISPLPPALTLSS